MYAEHSLDFVYVELPKHRRRRALLARRPSIGSEKREIKNNMLMPSRPLAAVAASASASAAARRLLPLASSSASAAAASDRRPRDGGDVRLPPSSFAGGVIVLPAKPRDDGRGDGRRRFPSSPPSPPSSPFSSSAAIISSSSASADDDAESGIVDVDPSPRGLRRLSAAIVGSGPSGMYAAKFLASSVAKRVVPQQQRRQSDSPIEEADDADDAGGGTTAPPPPPSSAGPPRASFGFSGIDVDVIERLPAPYGLVRYGVAPDHPEVKNVERDFASLFDAHPPPPDDDDDGSDDADAYDAGVATLSYFGNVDVGKDLSLAALRSNYDVVILAYGTQSSDNRLGIPGSGDGELDGVLSAREFVAWYNGHPEFGSVGDVVKRCLRRGDRSSTGGAGGDGEDGDGDDDDISPARVVVVGQGNVALDVARVLVKGGRGLADTDAPSSVLEILGGGASHVSVVGRRGHVQGAFTIKVGVRRRHAPLSSHVFVHSCASFDRRILMG